ncbi:MAG: immunoglobulin domain-containing protein [Phycisphaerales bacterium]|nr:immunoglobulin domain-containing protein [Phycisphaerales bacterium]
MARRMLCTVFLFALFVTCASAQVVTINTDVTVGPTDTTITGAEGIPTPLATAQIVVTGSATDLTINGRHEIASLTVTGGARVAHAPNFSFDYVGDGSDIVNGLYLVISGDAAVQSGSFITANGLGYPRGGGPAPGLGSPKSGGTHAGTGGSNSFSPYGSPTQPTEHGSGGGTWNDGTGNTGGGVIHLSVSGQLEVNGTITAVGGSSQRGGGGAGGSIWIEADSVIGSGLIVADGGGSTSNQNAHGGGGRVAIHAVGQIDPALSIHARGFFSSGRSSGAGTVYLSSVDHEGTLRIANTGVLIDEVTILSGDIAFPRIEITDSARVTPFVNDPSLHIIADELVVGSGAELSAAARGFAPGVGPGSGSGHAGGTHCGSGGRNATLPYGDILMPDQMGSGGQSWTNAQGAAGGGVLRLTIADSLEINGTITARGGSDRGGGGAGGSILVECGQLLGSGEIVADGGFSTTDSGAHGGGGRVAVYADESGASAVTLSAAGGFNNGSAGAGSLISRSSADDGVTLTFDNHGVYGGVTEWSTGPTFDRVQILNGTRLSPTGVQDNFRLNVAGDLVVDATSKIDANGRGFPTTQGPGAGGSTGNTSIYGAGGGGHGGQGGTGNFAGIGGPGGPSYGNRDYPTTMGSGAGLGPGGGGNGGGYIRLDVGGTVLVNGAIEANGTTESGDAAGGAGGGILIQASAVQGTGIISAVGADGDDQGWPNPNCVGSGGGGGGLIAIYACSVESSVWITSDAGSGCRPGQDTTPRIAAGYIQSSPNEPIFTTTGTTVAIEIEAAAGGGVYQWYMEGQPLEDGLSPSGSIIAGAQTDTLMIENVQAADGGVYQCTVAGPCFPARSRTFVLVVDGNAGSLCPVDVDGDGRIDIDDLYYITQHPTDINGDGVADYEDAACLERYLRRNELEDMTAGRR